MAKKNLFSFIDLNNGEEQKERVLENVSASISFRGAGLWILACAIVIACIGLNVNATAVIIGAMLISPLMGPIVGAGFALAIYDFNLLKRSGKNLLIATLVSLTVAFLYFYISPFKETQSELLARTSPNIYDVLIAFFGGLVGVIALTRVEKGNPIPGVAIATALMPPLCTAGYGLAIGQYRFFLGAFYLYAINCFFICIATYFIARYLKYKPIKFLNARVERRMKLGISLMVLLMILPSFYLAYTMLQEKKYTGNVSQFIASEFVAKGYTIIYKQVKYHSRPHKIELAFLTKKFNEDELRVLNKKLVQYNLNNTLLDIRQDARDIKSEILNELKSSNELTDKDILISHLQKELQQSKWDDSTVIKEMAILYPKLSGVAIGTRWLHAKTDSARFVPMLMFSATPLSESDTVKLSEWLRQRLHSNELLLVPDSQSMLLKKSASNMKQVRK